MKLTDAMRIRVEKMREVFKENTKNECLYGHYEMLINKSPGHKKLNEAWKTYSELQMLVSSSMKDMTLGHIKACDPCSYGDLLRECKDQVCYIEEYDDYDLRQMMDFNINYLVKHGDIIIESCHDLYDDGRTVICFRQA